MSWSLGRKLRLKSGGVADGVIRVVVAMQLVEEEVGLPHLVLGAASALVLVQVRVRVLVARTG